MLFSDVVFYILLLQLSYLESILDYHNISHEMYRIYLGTKSKTCERLNKKIKFNFIRYLLIASVAFP